jgi:hypothetical protein
MRTHARTTLDTLSNTPPWEWPEDAGTVLLGVLQDAQAAEADRLLAAELTGETTVINDDLVEALLALLRSSAVSAGLRGQAAISLGPILEESDMDGFDDADDLPITEQTFHRTKASLRELFGDTGLPREVRRRILEASVHAPEDWHPDAVRAAYGSEDADWRLTAVFCMGYLRGFDEQILEALHSEDEAVHRHALYAAGTWGVEAAWPHLTALITTKGTPKPLLLAAIEAVPAIRPDHAPEILGAFCDSEDEDIVAVAEEALSMAEALSEVHEDDDEWDEDEEE